MTGWIPLHCHSHYSLLDGLSKPNQIADVCAENGFEACALTDHGTVSGAVSFVSAMKKKGIKPILGCELYLTSQANVKSKETRKLTHLVTLAKNLDGWKELMTAVSKSNDDDVYYYKPRLDLDMLRPYASNGNLISFSGHPGSDLADVMFMGKGYTELHPNAKRLATEAALEYQDIFGKGNFFLEIQLIDQDNFKASTIIGKILREVSKDTGIPCVATADSHYPTREDAIDQRVLLCSSMKTTFKNIQRAFEQDDNVPLKGFFSSENFHIPSNEEMKKLHTEEEIENTRLIASMCQEYNILGPPKLPRFACPQNIDEDEYLRQLCRDGWKNVLVKHGVLNKNNFDTYKQRVQEELEVFKTAGLAGYFLIVQDYVNWAKQQGWLIGAGRGSGSGCLTNYLIGVTTIDPIPHDLLFSRFYNAGRNTAERVSFPDIDVDFPIEKRGQVIEYMKNKYGKSRVAQMCTFGRLQGRGAIKEVLRVHEACGFAQMNMITKSIPHEHEIEDKMKESGEHSILQWTLENEPKLVSDFCRINDNGTFEGEYATYFKQAIRLEGTYKSLGKHAAGVIITSDDLDNVCPMIRDSKGNEKMAGLEMNDLEAMGHIKFDILGLAALDKLMGVNNLLEFGETR